MLIDLPLMNKKAVPKQGLHLVGVPLAELKPKIARYRFDDNASTLLTNMRQKRMLKSVVECDQCLPPHEFTYIETDYDHALWKTKQVFLERERYATSGYVFRKFNSLDMNAIMLSELAGGHEGFNAHPCVIIYGAGENPWVPFKNKPREKWVPLYEAFADAAGLTPTLDNGRRVMAGLLSGVDVKDVSSEVGRKIAKKALIRVTGKDAHSGATKYDVVKVYEFMIKYHGGAGNAMEAVRLLNERNENIKTDYVPGSRRMVRGGKHIAMREHTKIRIDLSEPGIRKLARSIAGGWKNRLHEVAGHFKHYQLDPDCEHVWHNIPELDPGNKFRCEKCKGWRTWVDHHKRGNVELGETVQERIVTA